MSKPSPQESSTQSAKEKHANLSADSLPRPTDLKSSLKIQPQSESSNALLNPPRNPLDANSLPSTADDDDIIIIETKKKVQTANGNINMLDDDRNSSTLQKLEKRESAKKEQSDVGIKTEANTKEDQIAKDSKLQNIDSGSKSKGDKDNKKKTKETEVIDLESLDDSKLSLNFKTKTSQPQTIADPLYTNAMPNAQEILTKMGLSNPYSSYNPLMMNNYAMMGPSAMYGGLYGYNNLFDPAAQMQMSISNSYYMNQLAYAQYYKNMMATNPLAMANYQALQWQQQQQQAYEKQKLLKQNESLTMKDSALEPKLNGLTVDQPASSTNPIENGSSQPTTIWTVLNNKKVPNSDLSTPNENSNSKLDTSFSRKTRTAAQMLKQTEEENQKSSRKLKNKIELWPNNPKAEKTDDQPELSDSKQDKLKRSPTNIKFGRSFRSRNQFELTPKMKPIKKERKMNRLQLSKDTTLDLNTPVESKPYEIKVHQDGQNDEEIVNTRIGKKHQAKIVPFIVNEDIQRPKRTFKLVWTPENMTSDDFDKFMIELQAALGEEITNEESAIRQLKKFNMEANKLFESVKKNQKYYRNQFSGNSYQSILRLRNSGNNLNS